MTWEFTWTNWVNFAILAVTTLVGILTWLGARKSAREARADQREANAAAARSAKAAEEATLLQARIVQLEEDRSRQSDIQSRKARLHAERTHKLSGMTKTWHLTIINTGNATATGLRILVNDRPASEYSEITTRLSQTASIGSNGRVDLSLALSFSSKLASPFDVKLEWDDESGVRGKWVGTIA